MSEQNTPTNTQRITQQIHEFLAKAESVGTATPRPIDPLAQVIADSFFAMEGGDLEYLRIKPVKVNAGDAQLAQDIRAAGYKTEAEWEAKWAPIVNGAHARIVAVLAGAGLATHPDVQRDLRLLTSTPEGASHD